MHVEPVRTALIKERQLPGVARQPLIILAFALLISIGAFVYIPLPFTPVPLTMQVLFVLLAGPMLGWRSGTLSVVLYLLAGMVGFPVFAGAVGGFGRIIGPTGGYLLGFLLAPCTVAFLSRRLRKGYFALALSLFAGLFLIYGCGVLHLALFLHIPLGRALQTGMFPFIPGDILKVGLAMYVIQLTRRSQWNLRSSFQN